MALDSSISRFLTQLRADGRSAHTVGQYARHLRVLARWWGSSHPDRGVQAITHVDIADFLASDDALLRPDGRAKKATSVNAIRTSVRVFFDYLHRTGEVESNPARVVRMARTASSAPRPLRPDEIEHLQSVLQDDRAATATRDRALFEFLLGTGARLGSALAIDVGDVDLEASEVELMDLKGGGSMTVYLGAALAELLRGTIGSRRVGPLFCSQAGGRMTARHARRRFAEWLDRAGIPPRYSPHSLRHTFASRLYQRTGDIALVKEALGHRSITSTMVYATANAERVRTAVRAGEEA